MLLPPKKLQTKNHKLKTVYPRAPPCRRGSTSKRQIASFLAMTVKLRAIFERFFLEKIEL
jgi:hypothetical protein